MNKFVTILLLTLIFSGFFVVNKALAEEMLFTQGEVADSVKPSVVKIVQHVKGTASIPAIDVDFKTFSVTTKKNVLPVNIQIDEYITGSGVIVTPDGYIMTNSHIISYQTVKNIIASDFIYQAIDDGYVKLNDEEAKNISENKEQSELARFGEKVADYVLSESKFDITKNISVLNPASKKETLPELASEGFTASVVSVNDNFIKDSRDAALIKIEQQNLPAVVLGTSQNMSTGKKVYIFGYPSTAEINEKDLLDPTFSQGTISAIKDSPDKDFKIFQTDAKISKGSSGGPLLDEQGKVIGLVTFITGGPMKLDGDSFAFAIPIDVVKEIIASHKIAEEFPAGYEVGNYNKGFMAGLAYFKNNQCHKAIEEFDNAILVNNNFEVSRNVSPYKAQCEKVIASGKSVDNVWDLFKAKLGETKFLIIVLSVLGAFLIIALTSAWYWLFRRMKQDEIELDNVEEFLHLNLEDGKPIKERKNIYSMDDGLPEHLKPRIQK